MCRSPVVVDDVSISPRSSGLRIFGSSLGSSDDVVVRIKKVIVLADRRCVLAASSLCLDLLVLVILWCAVESIG